MSKTIYRAVKANDSNEIIAIGCDENQGGKDYNGVGVWCDFTFDKIPEVTPEIRELVKNGPHISLVKVENNSIVLKTVEEIETDIAKVNAVKAAKIKAE